MLYISLTYKGLNDNTPSYLQELIVTYYPVTEGRSICYQTPLLWNQLPVQVQNADTLPLFKVILKPLSFLYLYALLSFVAC